jgi:hypothetical protein
MSPAATATPSRRAAGRGRIALAVAAFVALGVVLFPSAGWDDAYITYWAAHALADLGRIVNVNGDPVEQSSSLGFVVVIAILRRISGIDAPVIGRLASMAFGAATIWATAALARRLSPAAGRASPILVATCAYFVYWSFGGMEATLAAWSGVMLLILVSRVLEEGRRPGTLAVMALVGLVYVSARPEGALILGATLAGVAAILVLRRVRRVLPEPWEAAASRTLPAIAVVSAAAVIALALFRVWYFGRLFPQPVYAKAHALSKQKVLDGLHYVLVSLQSEFLIMAGLGAVAAVLLAWSGARARGRAAAETVTAAFFLASLGFIVTSGGDGMHGGRFFVPAIPAAVALGVTLLARWVPAGAFRAAVIAWVLVQAGGALVFARYQSHSDPLWVAARARSPAEARFDWFERANHDHRRYFPVVAELERRIDEGRAVQTPVSILSGQSGFVMYHLGRSSRGSIRYFDRFALATRDFLECPVSASLPRTEWGLLLTVESFLRQFDQFHARCGIAAPDLIFELYWGDPSSELQPVLERAGYAVEYFPDVADRHRSRLFPGRAVGQVYVAVRRRR